MRGDDSRSPIDEADRRSVDSTLGGPIGVVAVAGGARAVDPLMGNGRLIGGS